MKVYFYVKTKCTNCGLIATNQPAGDGCHSCGAGYMKKIEE